MIREILVFALVWSKIGADNSIASDLDLIWYEANSTRPYIYKAKSNLTDGVRNSEIIEINKTINVLHSLDLSFATALKAFIIGDIGLTDIKKGAFKSLPALRNLTITGNNLKLVTEGVFNNLTIKHLNLSNNKIQSVKPDAFDCIKDLTTIVLDRNEISTYNLDFAECPKLESISLKYNFVEELSEGIFRTLKDNVLTVMLSYNRIKKIDRLAFDIKEFHEVHLDHNELVDAKLLIKLVKADKVDLSENHIECLPKEFMENGLSKIKILNLTNNPLNCTCLNDLRKKVRKNIEFQKMSPLVKNINIILPDRECDKKNFTSESR